MRLLGKWGGVPGKRWRGCATVVKDATGCPARSGHDLQHMRVRVCMRGGWGRTQHHPRRRPHRSPRRWAPVASEGKPGRNCSAQVAASSSLLGRSKPDISSILSSSSFVISAAGVSAVGVVGAVRRAGSVTVSAGALSSCIASGWCAYCAVVVPGGFACVRGPSVGVGASRRGAGWVVAGRELCMSAFVPAAAGSARCAESSALAGPCVRRVVMPAGVGASS